MGRCENCLPKEERYFGNDCGQQDTELPQKTGGLGLCYQRTAIPSFEFPT